MEKAEENDKVANPSSVGVNRNHVWKLF
jgi:hypothetical protein